MSEQEGLLRNRWILLAVFLGSLYGSVVSWLSVGAPAGHRPGGGGPILIFGLACAIFISASIALRSKFLWDRVVFGALAGALSLAAVRLIPPPTVGVLLAVNLAKALLWTTAASASLSILVRRPSASVGT